MMILIYGVKAYTPYASLVHSMETVLEVNVQKAENMFVSRTACSTKSQYINTRNEPFESVAKFKYL
jgi:hypothetical protein